MGSLFVRFRLIAVCAAILVAGSVVGGWSYRQAGQRARDELTAEARRCAAAFLEQDIRMLSATRDDLGNPVYASTKARLAALSRVRPGTPRIYLLRREPITGQKVFLADSTDVAQPGDVFSGAVESPGDASGGRVTGYAELESAPDNSFQAADILGMDVAADSLNGGRLGQALTAALGVWLLLGIPAGLLVARRNRRRREKTIRKLSEAVEECTRTEAGLREAKEKAEVESRAKGDFLATMGHELRTPLNGIVRFADLLNNTTLMPEQRDHVRTISSSSEALLKLTGNMLDYSWLEAGRMPLDPQPCDVRELIEGVLDLVSGHIADKNLMLLHRVAADVPARVEVDAGRLRQVLVNLLDNAVKFTAAGEVAVEAGVRPAGPAAGAVFLEFSVRDTGPGVMPADQGRLFRPFSQISRPGARRHGGTGLGLVISRSLVRLMGGDITMESIPDKGTTFRFHVTVRPLEAPRVSAALAGRRVVLVAAHEGLRNELAAVVAAAGGTPDPRPLDQLNGADLIVVDCDPALMGRLKTDLLGSVIWPANRTLGLVPGARSPDEFKQLRPFFRSLVTKPLHHGTLVEALTACLGPAEPARVHPQLGLRLLLVDDNSANLRLLQSIVGLLGCECVVAFGGQEGFEAVATGGRYDAVLLDLQMPEVDGVEVLRRLRAGEAGAEARDLWITIVTADGRAETRTTLFELGCDDFITKPVTVKSCLSALQRVVRNRPPRA